MTHTLFLITAYLFIGSLVMLLVNELLDGVLTEKEFMRGMVLWPAVAAYIFGQLLLIYARRIFRRG